MYELVVYENNGSDVLIVAHSLVKSHKRAVSVAISLAHESYHIEIIQLDRKGRETDKELHLDVVDGQLIWTDFGMTKESPNPY